LKVLFVKKRNLLIIMNSFSRYGVSYGFYGFSHTRCTPEDSNDIDLPPTKISEIGRSLIFQNTDLAKKHGFYTAFRDTDGLAGNSGVQNFPPVEDEPPVEEQPPVPHKCEACDTSDTTDDFSEVFRKVFVRKVYSEMESDFEEYMEIHSEMESKKPMTPMYTSGYRSNPVGLYYPDFPFFARGITVARRSKSAKEEYDSLMKKIMCNNIPTITPQTSYLFDIVQWYRKLSPYHQEAVRDRFVSTVGRYCIRQGVEAKRRELINTSMVVIERFERIIDNFMSFLLNHFTHVSTGCTQ